jgi:hypothetical protein
MQIGLQADEICCLLNHAAREVKMENGNDFKTRQRRGTQVFNNRKSVLRHEGPYETRGKLAVLY